MGVTMGGLVEEEVVSLPYEPLVLLELVLVLPLVQILSAFEAFESTNRQEVGQPARSPQVLREEDLKLVR